MKQIEIPLPLLGTLVGTRAMLGIGAGLLLAPCLDARLRRPIGWTLVAIGLLSTPPLAIAVFGHRHHHATDAMA